MPDPSNVFLCWSGQLSGDAARTFSGWIGGVVQAAQPWFSEEDIRSGEAWFQAVQDALLSCKVGVLFVTRENMKAPWLHFEAGAIFKQVGRSMVCPVLLDVSRTELEYPLAAFQARTTSKDEVGRLVLDIHNALEPTAPGKREKIRTAFEAQWDLLKLPGPLQTKRDDTSSPRPTPTQEIGRLLAQKKSGEPKNG
jgi:hypothetical protein